jgi:Fe-S-cluster containining protein
MDESRGNQAPPGAAERHFREGEAAPRYRDLVARLDAWTASARALHAERMQCRVGCDACCRRHLSVVSLEAEVLAGAAAALPVERRRGLRDHLEGWDERFEGREVAGTPCPLLAEGSCLLYEARPVLCRTHGFPLRTRPSGDPASGQPGSLVWCELNFDDSDREPFDEAGVLDIDRVNRTLGAIQALHDPDDPLRRVTIREALAGVRRRD